MMLIKKRARKPLAVRRHSSVSLHPAGVGGMIEREIVGVTVDDYTVFVSLEEWKAIDKTVDDIIKSRR